MGDRQKDNCIDNISAVIRQTILSRLGTQNPDKKDKPKETESKTELNLIPFRPAAIFRTSVINSSHSMRAVAPRQCVMIGKTNL